MLDAGLRFELLNGLCESDIKNAKFVVYAHKCEAGLYVGMTNDPVRRWMQHCQEAENRFGKYQDDPFKHAIRQWRTQFKHYILAVTNFEKVASSMEAAAIVFYVPKLNVRREVLIEMKEYGFKPIEGQIARPVILKKKAGSSGSVRVPGSLKTIVAQVVFDQGRKRLVCTSGQPFPAGLLVRCSKEERERFNVGDVVKVSVGLSEDGRFLVAPITARLERISRHC